jgi:hypothetical protein
MPKKEEYLDYFDDEELENWEEEIDALWEDDYGEFCDQTNEEKADEIMRRINKDDSWSLS